MTNRYRTVLLAVAAMALLVGAVWGWRTYRRVDGRTAAAWLAVAQRAAQTVSYRASGVTTLRGAAATFTLSQGVGGRYAMSVVDGKGRTCDMGNDGRYAWYRTQDDAARVAGGAPTALPPMPRARILTAGTLAGRPVVRVIARSGHTRRELAIDRKTGVVLATVTWEGRREIGRMQVRDITYMPVAVAPCAGDVQTTIHAVTPAEVRTLLGRDPVVPAWLPEGMTARGAFRDWCECCRQDMAVLRYSDGLRALTLFEVPGSHTCAMASGCRMAPKGNQIIDTRHVGRVNVVAVGDLDRATLQHVLASLQ